MDVSNIHIVFFSPTGSCRRAASRLAAEFSGYQTRLFDITRPDARARAHPEDGCGFLIVLFPVYAGGMPDPVAAFLSAMGAKGTPASVVAVYGNISRGNALRGAYKILTENGFAVASMAEIAGKHAYIEGCSALLDRQPDEKQLSALAGFIRKTADKIQNSKSGGNLRPARMPGRFTNPPAGLPQKRIGHVLLRPPSLDAGRCTRCMACRNACPVGAVAADLSVDNAACIRCRACASVCPRNARDLRFRSPLPRAFMKLLSKRPVRPRFYI